MWLFIWLYIVGLITSQATGKGNSTQMYFAKLIIDKNAIGNITELLRPFVSDTNLYVEDLRKTTTCKNVTSATECNCEPAFRWSDKLCASKKCCDNDKCNFTRGSSHTCVSKETVTVAGSVTLNSDKYVGCLAENNTDSFTKCNEDMLKKLKSSYSTLRGFDVLTITKYRVGSITADFEMTIARQFNLQNFLDTSEDLSKSLPASLVLKTTGVVQLSTPANPVQYNSTQTLRCAAHEDLGVQPEWELKRDNTVFKIFNGTESTVILGTKETEVRLKDISEHWEGEYTCFYQQAKDASYTISHKASFDMDICLLPDIDISTTPGFLDCRNSFLSRVTVECEIEESKEKYDLSWEKHDITVELIPQKKRSANGILVYAAETFVNCNSTAQTPTLTCTFKNVCNQTRKATVDVNIIKGTDQVCEAEGEWGVTKAGFTAVLKCKDAAGKRRRTCRKGSSQGKWDSEVSECVNWRIQNVLKKATVVDIGLGSLDGNAASVFSLLENVTNNSQTINTFANINASVQVLFTLSGKSNLRPNETVSRDFLEASSNLLEKSLNNSWKLPENNSSLADTYLSAVEKLVQNSNLTGNTKRKNIQVEARNCSTGSQCLNKVFNVTIALESQDPGNVKSVGFKNLEGYLPSNDDKFVPNSIVVSTITERKQLESLKVKITFGLLKSRPRNTELKCVFWDSNTTTWSDFDCKWDGPATEGRCVCHHLSSFAILMSKYPLEVRGTEAITNIGMSVSILSLVINIAIELTVWSAVVKTNTLYLRHTAHINIAVCLLVADCCFLASTNPKNLTPLWCQTLVVLKHFCYLSMFFWMLCLSCTLLHQTVFLFHTVSKKNYLRFSLVLGYACPLLIVAITLLAYQGGNNHMYFSTETCWLVFSGTLKGSIYAFVLPVGIIIFVNVFSMVVVIMKLLDHPKNAEASLDKEKKAAKTVMRSVILLTPVFGVTWILGFGVFILDLTSGFFAYAVNYAFTLLNAFQGLFILLITCLGEKLTRDALLNRLKIRALASTVESSKSDSTSKN